MIDLAFVGESAIGSDSAMDPLTPAPPLMSKSEFLAAAELPPGTSLPPGIDLPNPALGAFFQYSSEPNISGTHRTEMRTQPGCRQTDTTEPHIYNITGAQVDARVDPEDPNHLVGEKTISLPTGKTVIKWDLSRGQGE